MVQQQMRSKLKPEHLEAQSVTQPSTLPVAVCRRMILWAEFNEQVIWKVHVSTDGHVSERVSSDE